MAGTARLLLVGLGAHAKRSYCPIAERDGANHGFEISGVVDLKRNATAITDFLSHRFASPPAKLFLDDRESTTLGLDSPTAAVLDKLAVETGIRGVIIATDPLNHVKYGKWAMERGLSVLLDKPVSTRTDVSTNSNQAAALRADYGVLMQSYEEAKRRNPNISFSIAVQRRFHPMFIRSKELIASVFQRTGCPVTSVHMGHSDGQWLLPREIFERDYHPYNVGYGKCSHSGYHFFDILCWLIEAAERGPKSIDNIEAIGTFVWPRDFAAQISHLVWCPRNSWHNSRFSATLRYVDRTPQGSPHSHRRRARATDWSGALADTP